MAEPLQDEPEPVPPVKVETPHEQIYCEGEDSQETTLYAGPIRPSTDRCIRASVTGQKITDSCHMTSETSMTIYPKVDPEWADSHQDSDTGVAVTGSTQVTGSQQVNGSHQATGSQQVAGPQNATKPPKPLVLFLPGKGQNAVVTSALKTGALAKLAVVTDLQQISRVLQAARDATSQPIASFVQPAGTRSSSRASRSDWLDETKPITSQASTPLPRNGADSPVSVKTEPTEDAFSDFETSTPGMSEHESDTSVIHGAQSSSLRYPYSNDSVQSRSSESDIKFTGNLLSTGSLSSAPQHSDLADSVSNPLASQPSDNTTSGYLSVTSQHPNDVTSGSSPLTSQRANDVAGHFTRFASTSLSRAFSKPTPTLSDNTSAVAQNTQAIAQYTPAIPQNTPAIVQNTPVMILTTPATVQNTTRLQGVVSPSSRAAKTVPHDNTAFANSGANFKPRHTPVLHVGLQNVGTQCNMYLAANIKKSQDYRRNQRVVSCQTARAKLRDCAVQTKKLKFLQPFVEADEPMSFEDMGSSASRKGTINPNIPGGGEMTQETKSCQTDAPDLSGTGLDRAIYIIRSVGEFDNLDYQVKTMPDGKAVLIITRPDLFGKSSGHPSDPVTITLERDVTPVLTWHVHFHAPQRFSLDEKGSIDLSAFMDHIRKLAAPQILICKGLYRSASECYEGHPKMQIKKFEYPVLRYQARQCPVWFPNHYTRGHEPRIPQCKDCRKVETYIRGFLRRTAMRKAALQPESGADAKTGNPGETKKDPANASKDTQSLTPQPAQTSMTVLTPEQAVSTATNVQAKPKRKRKRKPKPVSNEDELSLEDMETFIAQHGEDALCDEMDDEAAVLVPSSQPHLKNITDSSVPNPNGTEVCRAFVSFGNGSGPSASSGNRIRSADPPDDFEIVGTSSVTHHDQDVSLEMEVENIKTECEDDEPEERVIFSSGRAHPGTDVTIAGEVVSAFGDPLRSVIPSTSKDTQSVTNTDRSETSVSLEPQTKVTKISHVDPFSPTVPSTQLSGGHSRAKEVKPSNKRTKESPRVSATRPSKEPHNPKQNCSNMAKVDKISASSPSTPQDNAQCRGDLSSIQWSKISHEYSEKSPTSLKASLTNTVSALRMQCVPLSTFEEEKEIPKSLPRLSVNSETGNTDASTVSATGQSVSGAQNFKMLKSASTEDDLDLD